MASSKDRRLDDESTLELASTSGVWKRAAAREPSEALHEARNLVFALNATLSWLNEICADGETRAEVREGLADLSAAAERLDRLLTDALNR
jgi:hypothetical protein